MLIEAEQSAYAQFYGNALELYDSFPLHIPLPVDSLDRVTKAVFSDHPKLFWLDTSFEYSYRSDGLAVAVTLHYNELAADINQSKDIFDRAAQPVLQAARMLGSDIEKQIYVHDYLLDNVSYVLDSKLNQSAYSAIVYGESVCSGYARAFQYLMQQLEIPCYLVTGYSGDVAHGWNIIKLGDGYYNVDVTWNDPVGNPENTRYYDFFNLTDAEMADSHTRTGLSINLPACNATIYSFANVFGFGGDADLMRPLTLEEAGFSRANAISSLQEYYIYIEDRLVELGEGVHTFSILLETESLMQAIFRATENNAAMEQYILNAADRLGLNGYSAGVSLQAEELGDGYWLLTQEIRLAGQ